MKQSSDNIIFQDGAVRYHTTSPGIRRKTGVVKFEGYGNIERKYAIVDRGTDVGHVLNLLKEDWKLTMPNHVISVTGSAKDFRVGNRLKGAFRRGLMKVVRSTGAWIITGGTNTGVMEQVGKAIRDYELTSELTSPVVSIGIATFGVLHQADKLEAGTENGYPVTYSIEEDKQDNRTYLDPYHSHFILVKDGDSFQYGQEIELRANLEKAVAAQKKKINCANNTMKESTPVVQLVLQGGINTLVTIDKSIANNIPVVLISGSGQVSDVLVYAYRNLKKTDVLSETEKRLKSIPNIGDAIEWSKNIKTLIENNSSLITVYQLLKSSRYTEDIDNAILISLLRANKESHSACLHLALDFNRINIAENIFEEGSGWKKNCDLDDIFERALEENKVEFVEMFLDKQVNIKEFLTPKRLLKLYSQQQWKLFKKKNDDELTQKDIERLFRALIGDFYEDKTKNEKYTKRNSKLDGNQERSTDTTELIARNEIAHKSIGNPFKELFIWSVLMNRQEMAKLFWRKCKDKTAAALVAFGILNSMASKTPHTHVSVSLTQCALEFGDLAVGVLNECFDSNETRAYGLLQRKVSEWSGMSCLELAVGTNNKLFLSQSACQSLISKMWRGNLSTDNGFFTVLGAVAGFSPISLFLLKYDDENTEQTYERTWPSQREDADICDDNRRGLSFWQKIQHFYSAPIVVFIHCTIFHFLFLALYSYVLLVDLSADISPTDYVLLVWVFTITVEEIRQVLISGLGRYVKSIWNIFDLVTILMFVCGITLRFVPHEGGIEVARVILGMNLMTFFVRTLHIFSVFQILGPKLVMISKMFMDLLFFLIILMIFVTGYAITSHAIIYPNSALSSQNIFKIFKNAYWNLYGELFLEEFEHKEPECTFNPALYNNETFPRCPTQLGTYVGPFLLGVYVLFSNVLLMNLLIAMFSYSFQKVQDESYEHWCFMRYFLIHEYKTRPVLPPPLIIICHVILMLQYVSQKLCCKQNYTGHGDTHSEEKRWENILAEKYLQQRETEEMEDINNQMKELQDRMESISSRDSLVDAPDPSSNAATETKWTFELNLFKSVLKPLGIVSKKQKT